MKSFYKTLRWEISFSRHRLPSIKLREAWPLNENCSDQLVRKLNQPALHFSQTLGLLVSRDWIQFRVTNYTFIFIKKIGLCLDSTSYTYPKIILVKMAWSWRNSFDNKNEYITCKESHHSHLKYSEKNPGTWMVDSIPLHILFHTNFHILQRIHCATVYLEVLFKVQYSKCIWHLSEIHLQSENRNFTE